MFFTSFRIPTVFKTKTMIICTLVATIAFPTGARADCRDPVIIYDEQPTSQMRHWIPSGWMPNGQGIAFSDSFKGDETVKPRSGDTCIRFGFNVPDNPWVGIYWLAGESWGDVRGPDIFKLLGIQKGDPVRLRVWARGKTGGERVQFKVAGVNKGRYPDSEPFPIATAYTKLTKAWKSYTIDLTNRNLSNLVGGFCVVLDRQHNLGQEQVWFYLDDIVIECGGER